MSCSIRDPSPRDFSIMTLNVCMALGKTQNAENQKPWHQHWKIGLMLRIIRPHCVKRQARDDAQRQQVKLLFFVGFVISVKQKHPSLPYNLPLWSCKPVVDGSPIRCNRQGWVSCSPFSYPFLVNLYISTFREFLPYTNFITAVFHNYY